MYRTNKLIKETEWLESRELPGGPVAGTLHFHCLRVLGSIPEIPQAAWCGQAKKKKKEKGEKNPLLLKTKTAEELENLWGKDQQSFKTTRKNRENTNTQNNK